MASLSEIGAWITANEQLLSGLAALVAVSGVALSGVGLGVRRLAARRRAKRSSISGDSGSAARVAEASPLPVALPSSSPHALARPALLSPDPTEPLLAVLAFENLSSDPELLFFSDGISEEIIQRLARGAKLRVIGKLSSFQLRGERKAEAAERLHCSHVLDGSIRRAEGRIRISVHLTDAQSKTTLWSERYDRGLTDVFAVQDEISDQIARALDQTFARSSTPAVDPSVYDLYLRATPKSYAPDELRTHVGLLEVVTQRAPDFTEAWGRLAYLRAWLHFYQPFVERPAIAVRVEQESARALAIDAQNVDALAARLFVLPPFGHFVETDATLERLRQAPGAGDGRRYIGYMLRTMGRIREGLEESERAYRLDALDPMSANAVALARLAAGRIEEAIPVYEDLVERSPEMSFPVSSLLRAHALRRDWEAVDRVLRIAEKRDLRELSEGIAFIRAKRDPSAENVRAFQATLEAHVAKTGCADIARLVYAAHLGLVDEAYRIVESARLGPAGTRDDVMGPDGYRTSLLFQAGMPEMRNDLRFPRLCARLGLVDFWTTTKKWPDCADEVPYEFRGACERAREVAKEPFGSSP
jgi:TolB-like protein/tetratricopeptide (TPR) repeat protein